MHTKPRWVLALTSVASLMVGLDILVVTTTLTTIHLKLGASLGEQSAAPIGDGALAAQAPSPRPLAKNTASVARRSGQSAQRDAGLILRSPGTGFLAQAFCPS